MPHRDLPACSRRRRLQRVRSAMAIPRGAPAPATRPPGKLRVIEAKEGSVDSIVRDALEGARTEGRTLIVYVGAMWCEPCQHFHHAAERGDLDSEFPRLTLLEFDLDRDRERLAAA